LIIDQPSRLDHLLATLAAFQTEQVAQVSSSSSVDDKREGSQHWLLTAWCTTAFTARTPAVVAAAGGSPMMRRRWCPQQRQQYAQHLSNDSRLADVVARNEQQTVQ